MSFDLMLFQASVISVICHSIKCLSFKRHFDQVSEEGVRANIAPDLEGLQSI